MGPDLNEFIEESGLQWNFDSYDIVHELLESRQRHQASLLFVQECRELL